MNTPVRLLLIGLSFLLVACAAAPVEESSTGTNTERACVQDADCGNGQLCAGGVCSAACAGIGEKCSSQRVCCFQDENGDAQTDAQCQSAVDGEDPRCMVVLIADEEPVDAVIEESTPADDGSVSGESVE